MEIYYIQSTYTRIQSLLPFIAVLSYEFRFDAVDATQVRTGS